MKDECIFISIAAYREFDLPNTIRDCIHSAAHPENLRFCICWQRDETESLAEFANDERFDIIDIAYQQSRGVCWARHLIQTHYSGEAYTLQIDGHHRFVQDWDRTCIAMVKQLQAKGYPKPILTGYMPSYDPHNDPIRRCSAVWLTGFDRFETRGVVFMRPHSLNEEADAPIPCRFWSAHFSFTLGQFNQAVVIDPDGYFHAEEIGTGVRAWTNGYDLFNPHRPILWHEYSRKGRVCHWDDHADWGELDAAAIHRYRSLFGVDGEPQVGLGPYGFGTQRTLAEYERFAGLCFATRGVQQYTLDNGVPPNPVIYETQEAWQESLRTNYCIDIAIERQRLTDKDCDCWGIFANAEEGIELFRKDYDRHQINEILRSQCGNYIFLFISFCSQHKPFKWTVWPHSSERGWLEPVDGYWQL